MCRVFKSKSFFIRMPLLVVLNLKKGNHQDIISGIQFHAPIGLDTINTPSKSQHDRWTLYTLINKLLTKAMHLIKSIMPFQRF